MIVQETVYDKVVKKLKERMGHLRLGNSLDKCMDMGVIVDPSQRRSIDEMVQRAKREGADVRAAMSPESLFISTHQERKCFQAELLVFLVFEAQQLVPYPPILVSSCLLLQLLAIAAVNHHHLHSQTRVHVSPLFSSPSLTARSSKHVLPCQRQVATTRLLWSPMSPRCRTLCRRR